MRDPGAFVLLYFLKVDGSTVKATIPTFARNESASCVTIGSLFKKKLILRALRPKNQLEDLQLFGAASGGPQKLRCLK